jgi:hypothetical protein
VRRPTDASDNKEGETDEKNDGGSNNLAAGGDGHGEHG